MRVYGDYHMHTRYSDGRASAAEMVQAAARLELEEIALTDHGPRNIGVGVRNLACFSSLRQEVAGLKLRGRPRVLVGVEANIISLDGLLDIPYSLVPDLDILLAGLHPYVYPANLRAGLGLVAGNAAAGLFSSLEKKVREWNTRALVACMERYPLFAVTHPGLKMPVEVMEVARACALTNTAYEINVGHLYQKPGEIRLAARAGARFLVSSDAHYPASVGRLEEGLALLEAAGVAKEQIVNIH